MLGKLELNPDNFMSVITANLHNLTPDFCLSLFMVDFNDHAAWMDYDFCYDMFHHILKDYGRQTVIGDLLHIQLGLRIDGGCETFSGLNYFSSENGWVMKSAPIPIARSTLL